MNIKKITNKNLNQNENVIKIISCMGRIIFDDKSCLIEGSKFFLISSLFFQNIINFLERDIRDYLTKADSKINNEKYIKTVLNMINMISMINQNDINDILKLYYKNILQLNDVVDLLNILRYFREKSEYKEFYVKLNKTFISQYVKIIYINYSINTKINKSLLKESFDKIKKNSEIKNLQYMNSKIVNSLWESFNNFQDITFE